MSAPDRSRVVLLAWTAYGMGQKLGLILPAVFGVAFVLVGLHLQRSASASTTPTRAASGLLVARDAELSRTDANGVTGPDNAFFAGQVAPSAPETSRDRWDLSAMIATAVGLLLICVAIFQGYHLWTNSNTTIDLPNQLLGLERVEDPALEKAFDDVKEKFEGNGLSNLQMAAYGAPAESIIVVGGRISGIRDADAEVFGPLESQFGMTDTGGSGMVIVEPGPQGGQVRCTVSSAQSTNACVWLSADALHGDGVYGAIQFEGNVTSDYAQAVQTVRGQIEK